MNLPTEWQHAFSSPLVLLLVALVVITLVLVFILPPTLSLIGKVTTSKTINGILKTVRKKPALVLLSCLIGLVIILIGFLVYLWTSQIQTISAEGLLKKEPENVEFLQKKGTYDILTSSDAFLVDIRSGEIYDREHIQGAFNLPLEIIKQGKYKLPKDKKIYIYSSEDKLDEAKLAADMLKKQVKKRIYVIKGGFEALKKTGLSLGRGSLY